jgi:hypothetical protein
MHFVTIVLLFSTATVHSQTLYLDYAHWEQMPASFRQCILLELLTRFRLSPYLREQCLPDTTRKNLEAATDGNRQPTQGNGGGQTNQSNDCGVPKQQSGERRDSSAK